MNILNVINSDLLYGGGGAIAMNRLHKAFLKYGHSSRIMSELMTTDSELVYKVTTWPLIEKLLRRLTSRMGLNDLHKISSYKINKNPAYQKSDIIHIHGTHSGFINYLFLPNITKGKPSFFTLHDMWALTGHCAYSFDCERWKDKCGKCPYPESHPPIRFDNTRLELLLKRKAFLKSPVTLITPSIWLYEKTKNIFGNSHQVVHIPNGVDLDIYKPNDNEAIRTAFSIPKSRKIIMFAALDVQEHRKGGDLLLSALSTIPESFKKELFLLVVGQKGERTFETTGIKGLNVGFINNDHLMSLFYSVADIFVHPSRADNFPLTLLESLACGTPVVGFPLGGTPEIVRDGQTGLLAEPDDCDSLSKCIIRLIDDTQIRRHFADECVKIATKEYSLELQAKRHLELYAEKQ